MNRGGMNIKALSRVKRNLAMFALIGVFLSAGIASAQETKETTKIEVEPLEKDANGRDIEPWRVPDNPNIIKLDPGTLQAWRVATRPSL